MSRRRKTLPIDLVVNVVNDYLKAEHTTVESRRGAITVIENMLLSSDSYRGFKYLTKSEVPSNARPGIQIRGFEQGSTIDLFEDTDQTRRQYY